MRLRWPVLKRRLQEDLLAGRYRFSPVRRFQSEGESIELWASLDAVVLKALALVLNRRLGFSRAVYHLGCQDGKKRGAKAAVRAVCGSLAGNAFVFRTDVKSYYASIDHDILFDQLRQRVDDPCILDLVDQYLRRTIDENCLYSTVGRGISLGCPLSPIMGALYLDLLDRRMEASGFFYVRFMDDWVILTPTRWALRRAVRVVNQTLAELKVEQHPDKTFIGRVVRGFTFLGYQIGAVGIIGVAPSCWKGFEERVLRLYEQNAPPDVIRQRIGDYARRWMRWVVSGVQGVVVTRRWPDGFPGSVSLPRAGPSPTDLRTTN